jgi:hypothetical protein
MEILEKIFGSAAKVKMMRLFLFNPESAFDLKDIRERAKVSPVAARKEINILEKIDLVKRKNFTKEVFKGKGSNAKIVRTKTSGWFLNASFPYLHPLQNFLIHISPLKHKDIVRKLNGVGSIKLLVVSGVFIQELESRVDLLIVGDHLKKSSIESVIGNLEAEIGKEIKYASFETPDFQYRLSMCDKLVRDILDYPHEKIIEKINVS